MLGELGALGGHQKRALEAVLTEWREARDAWPRINSAHEGYAVILEELDELWAEIKSDKRIRAEQHIAMRHEAIQVAAMALRFLDEISRDDFLETGVLA